MNHITVAAAALSRRLFPPTKLSAELNAAAAVQGFGWLVGDMELKRDSVQVWL
jgi:hypothetical protein